MYQQAERSDGAREFVFNVSDFQRIARLIYEHAGISLAASKQEMVYSRLARRLRARNLTRFTDYIGYLESTKDPVEWEAFVNSLTTNLTSFFREPHHFTELARFLEQRRNRAEPITIWCAASSTGEEPYSIAMTAVDVWKSFNLPVTIVATDLDTNVLAKAESGVYTADRVEKLAPDQLRRFFLKGTGANAGSVRVRRELRSLITFRQLNLLDTSWPVRGPFDAIFCRNVMIYFDKPTQRKVLQKLAPLVRHDGLLFAGHSESFLHSADVFRLRGNTVYELAPPLKLAASGR
ncbi:MAG TPA: CheR family methyltransferase [Burkholderiales bacterium]|nr:CheR family methyltransferase [Burkholderiales bacterium]